MVEKMEIIVPTATAPEYLFVPEAASPVVAMVEKVPEGLSDASTLDSTTMPQMQSARHCRRPLAMSPAAPANGCVVRPKLIRSSEA
eukprot:1931942-Prymnesium_polylepis.1